MWQLDNENNINFILAFHAAFLNFETELIYET